ncbi:MAG: ATP-binding protein [Acidobacteriota bacterium]
MTLDAGAELDPHNLQYQDVLLALARNLLADLAEQGIEIDADHWRQLAGWFDERIEQHEETRSYAAELRAGAQAKSGLPLLASLFAGVTAAIRTNATHKETLRRIVRNHYADFASAFNDLIRAAEDACHEAGLGARILFIVDGTDKQRGEDAEAFFVRDVHQLKAIDGIFLYSTPIRMLHAYGALNQHFTGVFKLPMIKLVEKDGARHEAGWAAMRELLYRRAPQSLFERADVADHLIAHSGGHPRDLLRLLSIAFSKATGEHFDMPGAKGAVAEVAAGYRRLLEADDYPLLAAIDAQPDDEHNMKRVRELLDQLVILEYNAYWWRTHPAVQTLPAYRKQVETHDG